MGDDSVVVVVVVLFLIFFFLWVVIAVFLSTEEMDSVLMQMGSIIFNEVSILEHF